MKVVMTEKGKYFKEIEIGQAFLYNNEVFLKTEKVSDFKRNTINAVGMDGIFSEMRETDVVELLPNAEVVVK